VGDNAGMFVRVWEVRSGATMPPTTSASTGSSWASRSGNASWRR